MREEAGEIGNMKIIERNMVLFDKIEEVGEKNIFANSIGKGTK